MKHFLRFLSSVLKDIKYVQEQVNQMNERAERAHREWSRVPAIRVPGSRVSDNPNKPVSPGPETRLWQEPENGPENKIVPEPNIKPLSRFDIAKKS